MSFWNLGERQSSPEWQVVTRDRNEAKEIKRLKAEIRKLEAPNQKLIEENLKNQQRFKAEVKTLRSEMRILEERLQREANENLALAQQVSSKKIEIVKQQETIKQLNSNNISENTRVMQTTLLTIMDESQSSPLCQSAKGETYEDNKENTSSVAELEKQHSVNLKRLEKKLASDIAKLERKISEEEVRFKKGMERLEVIKTKRRLLQEERAKEQHEWKKDKTQREFDDMMERLIQRVKEQKIAMESLRQKVRPSTSNGRQSDANKRLASLEKESLMSISDNAPRPSSIRPNIVEVKAK